MPSTTTNTTAPSWFASAVLDSSSTMSMNKTKSLDYPSSDRTSLLKNTTAAVSFTKMVVQRPPVKFDDSVDATVVHLLEPCVEDPQQLWFSKQEIQELRKEGKASLAKVNDGGGDLSLLDEALGESIRGLEHGLSVFDQDGTSSSALDEGDNASVTALASLDRSQRRKNIVETILCQQHEQKESGIYDVKGLQVTSAACTQWARDRAQDQAKKDFDDAVKVWKEDALCAALLPSMLKKKKRISVIRRSGSLTSEAERRKTALDSISATLSSALEELDDIDF